MNAHRTPKTTRAARSASSDRVEPAAGSGQRRRSSQPALPPLDAPKAAKHDPELETRLFMLVTAVERDEGMSYPPEWATVVDAAKRRGWLAEKALSLHLTSTGRQWLATRAAPTDRRQYEMTKIRLHDRLRLKDLARDTGTPMQEVIGHVIGAIHEHRDELTRAARRVGETHPWEGVGALLRAARKA